MLFESLRLRESQEGSTGSKSAEPQIIVVTPEYQKSAELDLDAEWIAQAGKLADLFAPELDMSSDEYFASLPAFLTQPESYKGRLNIPLIVAVHPQIGLDRMLRLAGIKPYYNVSKTEDWKDRRRGFTTPQVPYTTWVSDGSNSLGRSVSSVRHNLADDERGGTVFDGLALYLKNPKILQHHYLDLPGSEVRTISAPAFSLWLWGEPALRYGWAFNAGGHFGSICAGREINTQPLAS